MQPGPTQSSTQFSTPSAPASASDIHHGFHSNQQHPADSNERSRNASFSSNASGSRYAESESSTCRLSDGRASHASPIKRVNRIAEYENASLPASPRMGSEGPSFKVIMRKDQTLNSINLDEFPNEVLTHILSHLPAASLSAVSLVSKRFYSLVTTPHAWRIAFSRFFPGQESEAIAVRDNRRGSDLESRESLRAEQRVFTRLTGLATWRSEYILRTRLLRSLSRGKPAQLTPGHGVSSRSNSAANNANAVVTYNSQLFATINHIHAEWNMRKKSPRFMHGADDTGYACTSDPNIGRVDNWGLSDPQSLPQFSDLFPGDQAYGLGEGQMIGAPNVMDVSHPFGMVYGEGFPGGQTYFRASQEMRGRFLANVSPQSEYELGIPAVPADAQAMCTVWIAKSTAIPTMTDGLVGIMSGSSCGIITAYSVGADNLRGSRLHTGEITARWMLCPGIPIIAICVDESYNVKRHNAGRIWAVVLNALGEVYYLSEIPQRGQVEPRSKHDEPELLRTAWKTGRSVFWNFVEPTRRIARDDPYNENEYDGSYSPRSSCDSMKLGKEQIINETKEIEKFLAYKPAHFRRICDGWDMRRRLEVDFAGDDNHRAGEGIVVISCGIAEDKPAQITRFSRLKVEQSSFEEYPVPKTPPIATTTVNMASLFGGGVVQTIKAVGQVPARSTTPEARSRRSKLVEEWRSTLFRLPASFHEITTSTIDMSTFALPTAFEDPLLSVNGESATSSPFASPAGNSGDSQSSLSDVPGHRARFLAVGTTSGSIIIWNMRGAQSSNSALTNELSPLRTIQTDSPQISCLAVSALYVVHGGNDGLVQAWDHLASTLQPIRTLNSRFSSRARRRLIQAEASVQGVGINLFAAGALTVDPDPTVLRGMVSLGTHLRYWSYSSTAAEQVSSKKRRLRRSAERGNNGGSDRFTNTGRGALMDYIATEQEDLRKDKQHRAREQARLRGRFGVGLGDLTDEEAIRYAEMVSQETFQKDQERQLSDAGYFGDNSSVQSEDSSETVTPEGSMAGDSSADNVTSSHSVSSPPNLKTDDEFDYEIEEAIRLSLLDGIDDGGRSPKAPGSGEYDIPIRYKEKKSKRSTSSSPSTSQLGRTRRKQVLAVDDLEYALQLSLAEERSREQVGGSSEGMREGRPGSKGKGRAK